MLYAEYIINAYKSRQRSENWAEWVHNNPRMSADLAEAEKYAND